MIHGGIVRVRTVVDFVAVLNDLRERKRRLEETILVLEQIQAREPVVSHSGRGRKSMGEEERRAVSQRIKSYWAARRAARAACNDGGQTETQTSTAEVKPDAANDHLLGTTASGA